MGIVITLLALVILTSGCTSIGDIIFGSNYSAKDTSYNTTSNVSTKIYDANGISFKYPSSWYTYNDTAPGGYIIFASKNIGFNTVQFQVQTLSNNGMSEEEVIKQTRLSSPGWDKIGSYSITIDNKTAYEDIYKVNEPAHFSRLMRIVQIILVKNDKTYLMLLQAPDDEFESEKPNFAVILNSFKVNS